jgi:hypothetical protein
VDRGQQGGKGVRVKSDSGVCDDEINIVKNIENEKSQTTTIAAVTAIHFVDMADILIYMYIYI